MQTIVNFRFQRKAENFLVPTGSNYSYLNKSVLCGVSCLASVKSKGKAVPLQAWSGPEGSRQLRLPDFLTTAQPGGNVVSLTHRPPSPPGNTHATHFC